MGDRKRMDGEMVYQEEDDETVNSEVTNSVMGCIHNEAPGANHLRPVVPPLAQPSQLNNSDTSLTPTPQYTPGHHS